MAFNPENKVTFNELAPSLQALINSKEGSSNFEMTRYLAEKMNNQLNDVRITITSNTANVPNPVVNKEMLMNTTDHVMYGFNGNRWYACGGCYS